MFNDKVVADMDIEKLTKTQVVLLVLLVSFVTSLATGIVTVTLVNQAPEIITHTVSKVVEKAVPKEVAVKEKTVVFSNEENLVKVIKNASLAVVGVFSAVLETTGTATTTESATTTSENFVNENKVFGGSGFFVSEDGVILTNKHSVEDETKEYFIKTGDGKKIPAVVLLRDAVYDIAVLKAEGKKFNYIPMSDSSFINVGQTAIAIGNAFEEQQNNVSIGFVSGFNNMAVAIGAISGAKEEISLIKSNIAINENNSGGPMLDLKGNAIGISIALTKERNAGFALPINLARKAVANALKIKN